MNTYRKLLLMINVIRNILPFISVLIILNLNAQNSSIDGVLSLYRSGKYDQAAKDINDLILKSELGKLSSTWFYRGQIYQAMYTENENKVYALDSAYFSLVRSLKLDPQKEFLNNLVSEFNSLSSNYYRRGALEFNNGKYMLAYKSFEKALDINKTPLIARSDTNLIFYSAISALNCNNINDAKKLFEKLVFLNCINPDIYLRLGDIYKNNNEIAKANEIFSKGLTLNPGNFKIIESLINVNLNYGLTSEALKYIEEGKKYNPQNGNLYFYEAELYNLQKQEIKAKESYINGLKYDEFNYNANFNLGILYYNSAIVFRQSANQYKNNDIPKYKAELSKFNIEIMKAKEHLEKAYNKNEKDKNLNLCLIEVYKLLNRDDDADRIVTTMKINGVN